MYSCTDWSSALKLENKSNINVFYVYKLSPLVDTLLDCSEFRFWDGKEYMVSSGGDLKTIRHLGAWGEPPFKSGDEILHLYILQRDSLKRPIILKRFDYTYQQLENINWIIQYSKPNEKTIFCQ